MEDCIVSTDGAAIEVPIMAGMGPQPATKASSDVHSIWQRSEQPL
jgi:hypothetical protein